MRFIDDHGGVKRSWWWGAGGVVVLFTTVGILVAVHTNDVHSGAKPGAASTTPAAGQADDVATALRRLATDPQSLVASAAQSTVQGHASDAIPAGSTVTPDVRSWAPDGIGGGTMLVTIITPAGVATTYAAVMVFEDGAWRVLATFPVPTSSPAS
jgi:hypothetical protein